MRLVVLVIGPTILAALLITALIRRERRTQGLDAHTGQWTPPRPVPLTRQEVVSYALCYLLYAVLAAYSLFVLLTWSTTIWALVVAFIPAPEAHRFAYMTAFMLVGFTIGSATLAAETYLRKGVPQRRLLVRFVHGVVAVSCVGGLGFLLRQLALVTMQ